MLVVDDHVDAAEMIAVLLEANGFEARVVNDGRSAVNEAEAYRPHVMLLDLSMPHVSGLDVCREVRLQPWGQDICIIALTGWTGDTHRQQTTAAGFDRYLMKPVEPDTLLEVLRAIRL